MNSDKKATRYKCKRCGFESLANPTYIPDADNKPHGPYHTCPKCEAEFWTYWASFVGTMEVIDETA